jgi:hypothetical protein
MRWNVSTAPHAGNDGKIRYPETRLRKLGIDAPSVRRKPSDRNNITTSHE